MYPSSVPGFPGFHVGDRVRVLQTHVDTESRFVGREGVLVADFNTSLGGHPVAAVRNSPDDGTYMFTYARRVEKVEPEQDETPASRLTRVQAAKAAGEILASDASVAEIVELARYLEGSPQPSSAAAPEPVLTLAKARELVADGFSSRSTRVRMDRTTDSDVLDLSSGYIHRDDMPGFIEFCKAAVMVHDATRSGPTPSGPTPF